MFAGLTALALFIAVVLVGPAIARPLAHTIGAPFRRAGVAGDLGVRQRRPQPGAYGPHGQRPDDRPDPCDSGGRARVRPSSGATRGALESQITADYIVEGSGETDSVPVAVERELDKSGFASAVVGVRTRHGRGPWRPELEITAVNQLEVTEAYPVYGTAQHGLPVRALDRAAAVVDRDFAAENGPDIGSSLEIKTPTGDREIFTVRAFEDAPAISKLDPIPGR